MKKTAAEMLWMALFIAVPFAYAGQVYEGAMLPKLLLSQLGLAAICLICAFRPSALPANITPLLGALGCYAMLHTVSIAAALNSTETILQLAHHIAFLLIPLLVAATLSTAQISRVISVAAWTGFPIALIGLAQYLGRGFEGIPSNASPSATFFHRNAAAAYVITIAPFSIAGFWRAQTPPKATAWAVLMTVLGAFLICTRTRAAWAALVAAGIAVGLLVLTMRRSHSVPNKRIKSMLSAIACALIVLSAFLPEHIRGTRKQRFDEKKSDAITAVSSMLTSEGDRGRFDMWRRTLSMIEDHPLGVGLGNWQFVYPRYARGVHVNVQAAPERPHNDLLWIASELGLTGLAAFLAVLLIVGRSVSPLLRDPQTRILALGFLAVITAYIVDGLFSFPRAQIMPALGFWFAIGGLPHLKPNSPRSEHPHRYHRLIFTLAFALLLCAIAISVRRIQYDTHHLRVHTAERAQDWPTVIREAERAMAYGALRANTFIALGRARYRTGDFTGALQAYETALRLHPNSLNAHNNQGIAFRRSGQPEKAEKALKQAIYLYPTFREAHYNLGLVYLDMKRWRDAIAMFEKAQNWGLNSPRLFFNLGRAHYAQRQVLQAQTSFLKALERDPNYAPARAALSRLGVALPSPPKGQEP